MSNGIMTARMCVCVCVLRLCRIFICGFKREIKRITMTIVFDWNAKKKTVRFEYRKNEVEKSGEREKKIVFI